MSDPIVILLPVYNGARHLRSQIDSILQQTHTDLLILCRDDGSVDDSIEILLEYQEREPERVRLLQDQQGNLGASANVSRLMEQALQAGVTGPEATAPEYFALADQDDLWAPERLERGLAVMQELEAENAGQPLLVHSDLRVVDDGGELIADSLAQYQGLEPEVPGLPRQLMINTVTGCTALFNRALLERAVPIPAEAIMHDWWLSLVAEACGRRVYIRQALVDYRQHADNALGARLHAPATSLPGKLRRLFSMEHSLLLQRLAQQAAAFEQRHPDLCDATVRARLRWMKGLAWPIPVLQKLLYRLLRARP